MSSSANALQDDQIYEMASVTNASGNSRKYIPNEESVYTMARSPRKFKRESTAGARSNDTFSLASKPSLGDVDLNGKFDQGGPSYPPQEGQKSRMGVVRGTDDAIHAIDIITGHTNEQLHANQDLSSRESASSFIPGQEEPSNASSITMYGASTSMGVQDDYMTLRGESTLLRTFKMMRSGLPSIHSSRDGEQQDMASDSEGIASENDTSQRVDEDEIQSANAVNSDKNDKKSRLSTVESAEAPFDNEYYSCADELSMIPSIEMMAKGKSDTMTSIDTFERTQKYVKRDTDALEDKQVGSLGSVEFLEEAIDRLAGDEHIAMIEKRLEEERVAIESRYSKFESERHSDNIPE